MIQIIDTALSTPQENLALDEALLLALERDAAAGKKAATANEVLRLWESPVYCVVLGASSRRLEESRMDACLQAGIPVLRRASGGGTVLLGPGCLSYSLILALDARPELRAVRLSYQRVLQPILDALDLPGAARRGVTDLCLHDRKFSGSAQRRTHHGLLHHGTVLYDFDTPLMERYLRPPPRQPGYRGRRGHTAFVTNLALEGRQVRDRIARAWGRGGRRADVAAVLPCVEHLVRSKYDHRDWLERR